MQLLLALCCLFAFTYAGVASVDFAATTPQCYDHKIGGGSFNDAQGNSVVESLQGGDFVCKDVVSHLWYVEMNTDSAIPATTAGMYAEFILQFTGSTTGQEGIGYTQVRTDKVYINSYRQPYVNGDGCLYGDRVNNRPNCTRGTIGSKACWAYPATATSYDSAVLSNGAPEEVLLLRQWFSGNPPFMAGSNLNVALRIGGVNRLDRIVIRIDVEIGCDPFAAGPTGNLQGQLSTGWYGYALEPVQKPSYLTDRATADVGNVWAREAVHHQDVVFAGTISGGQQTVPLKSVDGIQACTPPTNVSCVNFKADMVVSVAGVSGTSNGKFNYCWDKGLMSWSYGGSTNTSTTSTRTFDATCTSNHASLYDTQKSTCGVCEVVDQFPTAIQPQLCFNSLTNYYLANPVSAPLVVNGVTYQTWRYFANATTTATTGVTDLWLNKVAVGGLYYPVQIQWVDGKVFSFYNVNPVGACDTALYSASGCTSFGCARPIDLILVSQLSLATDTADQLATRNFLSGVINRFTFGTTAAQMGYLTFNTAATTRLALSAGTSRQNVGSAINATGCSGGCSGLSTPSIAIRAAADMAAASTRAATAAGVVLVVLSDVDETAASLQSAITYAASKGVYVIAVVYNSGTPLDFFYNLVSDPGTYGTKDRNLWYVPQVNDLNSADLVTLVGARLCGLVTVSESCSECCGAQVCDTAFKLCTGSSGTATPCNANLTTTCPNYNNCGIRSEKDPLTGCCKDAFQNTCPNTTNAQCQSPFCNSTSGQCYYAGGCVSNTTLTGCQQSLCRSTGGVFSCSIVAIPAPTDVNVSACEYAECVGNAWVKKTINCTGGDECATFQCVAGSCQLTPKPDANSGWANSCNRRICNASAGGWVNQTVVCAAPNGCSTSACVIGTGCVNTALNCNNVSNLCDITTCIPGPTASCPVVKTNKTCTPKDACFLTSTCQPASGLCLDSNPMVCAFDTTLGCPTKCVAGACVPYDCPVDCSWNPWSSFSDCSVTCASGTQTRSRTWVNAINGGVACNPADATQSQPCNNGPCPIDCVWSTWSAYSPCTVACGGGTRTSTRTKIVFAQNNGAECIDPANDTITVACNTPVCTCDPNCPTPCIGSWSSWGACNCTTGFVGARTFTITTAATNGGEACTYSNGFTDPTQQSCSVSQLSGCPTPCEGAWTSWSSCSCPSTCTGCTRSHTYVIVKDATNGGAACTNPAPGTVETDACTDTTCVTCTAANCKNTPCDLYECKLLSGVSFCDRVGPRDCSAALTPGDNCQSLAPCNSVTGCAVITRNCATENIPHTKCEIVVQDSSDSTCCKVVPKPCQNSDPCASVTCNEADGVCKSTNLCTSSDPCLVSSCNGTGCQVTPFCQSGVIDPTTCSTTQCTVTSGSPVCGGTTLGCVSTDPCQIVTCVAGVCAYSPRCTNTSNLCELTQCVVSGSSATCVTTPVATQSASGCKNAGCDPVTGPYAILNNTVCQDGNPCTTSLCSGDGTCVRTPVSCLGVLANESYCKPAICIDFVGCVLTDLDCYSNSSVRPSNNSCQILECQDCDPKNVNCSGSQTSSTGSGFWGKCKTTGGDCFPLFALIGGLAGGIIAAIVVGAILAAALCSGTTYALATGTQDGDAAPVTNNPLHVPKGNAGTNPLQGGAD